MRWSGRINKVCELESEDGGLVKSLFSGLPRAELDWSARIPKHSQILDIVLTVDLEANKQEFQRNYQLGKQSLENGQYSLSVKYLEEASQRVTQNTLSGGEVRIWLVSAYQAAQKIDEAIALCRELLTHPHPDIRENSKRLLYIMEAPRLKRPQEWMSEIPDLTALPESTPEFQRNRGGVKPKEKKEEPVDLATVNTKDNQFVAIGFLVLLISCGALIWLNK